MLVKTRKGWGGHATYIAMYHGIIQFDADRPWLECTRSIFGASQDPKRMGRACNLHSSQCKWYNLDMVI